MQMINRIFKSITRIFSFPKKELTEILRQPRLILTLVLGPFLIILLFGISFPEEGRSLRTTFVVSDQNPFREQVESFAKTVGPAIIYQGVESDREVAMANLALGQTDMVVVVPDNPFATIQYNEQATLEIFHNEIDPFQIAYVRSVGRIYTDEVNRRVLEALASEGKQGLQENLSSLNQDSGKLDTMSSIVLVRPFRAEFSSLADVNLTPVGFLTPSVIVLLLQHLSVTFAALSIVRERRSGIMELFRVAPLKTIETLLGKYFSYLLFGIALTVLLTALAIWGMGVPMLGSWVDLSLASFALLFASLGVGFAISLISETEIQAVQYSMLFLLASVFFSGFFLDLRLMKEPMTAVAWTLPATYGIRMLQDVILRGYPLPLLIFEGVSAIGVILFFVDWLLLKRKMDT